MKLSTSLLLLLFSFSITFAQFTVSSDTAFIDTNADESYAIINIQNDSIAGNILWVLTTECEPQDWVHYVGNQNINYIPGVDSFSFQIGANQTDQLAVFLLFSESEGVARYTIEIWKEGDRENNKFLHYFVNNYSCEPTNTNSMHKSETIRITPNPFFDNFIVETNIPEGEITVFDIYGRQFIEKNFTTPGSFEISSGQLIPGTYIIQIKDSSGQISTVKKVLKQ